MVSPGLNALNLHVTKEYNLVTSYHEYDQVYSSFSEMNQPKLEQLERTRQSQSNKF